METGGYVVGMWHLSKGEVYDNDPHTLTWVIFVCFVFTNMISKKITVKSPNVKVFSN